MVRTLLGSSRPRQSAERPKQRDNKNRCDHGQGEGNRDDGLLTYNLAPQRLQGGPYQIRGDFLAMASTISRI
jgi:hypothetical protein